ncbi:MAG: hypothetical protein ACOYJS_02130 [Acutalibacteraceae bacterium]|jgi:hypothetical protein
MKNRLKKKDGYILISAIIIFLVSSLIMATVTTVSLSTNKNTEVQYNYQQAYYTARSAVSAVAEYIIDNSYNPLVIDGFINRPGKGSINGMGDYTVYVQYTDDNRIMITAESKFNKQTATATAYLIKPPVKGFIPTDSVVYVNGSAATGIGQSQLYGTVYIDGDLNLGQGSFIYGYAVVKGNTHISGYGHTTSGLFGFGNVTLYGSGTVNGDVYTKGDLIMDSGSGKVDGNVYVDGSLFMNNGSSVIYKDATVGGNVEFGGGSNRIYGNLNYKGSVETAYGSVGSFVKGISNKITDYTPVDDASYLSRELPIIKPPTPLENPALYHPVIINNNTITGTGSITSAVVAELNSKPYGTVLTIDTSSGDISLLLADTNFNLNNGLNIEVTGPNNVFIYMTGSSSMSINSNSYVGMKVRGSNPRLFIFGDDNQSISLNNNSELDACVYIPNGTMNASGAPLTTYKFIGSCTVKKVNLSSNVKFFYSKPDLDETPLDIFNPSNPGSAVKWVIQGWE